MIDDEYVSGGFIFDLPLHIREVDHAVMLPEDPLKWAERMKESLAAEGQSVSLVTEMLADGSESISLTLCPSSDKHNTDSHIKENLSICLSNNAAFKLGKALIALAQLSQRNE